MNPVIEFLWNFGGVALLYNCYLFAWLNSINNQLAR